MVRYLETPFDGKTSVVKNGDTILHKPIHMTKILVMVLLSNVVSEGDSGTSLRLNLQMTVWNILNTILKISDIKIPMTTPVITEVLHGPGPDCESNFTMHFLMPFAFKANPPQPTEQGVYIRNVPEMTVFVK